MVTFLDNGDSSASIKFPTITVLSFSLLSMFLIGIAGWKAWKLHLDSEVALSGKSELDKLSVSILHFDEILTMSARLAVITGNPFWEKRYQHFEPKLRASIEKTRKIPSEPVLLTFAEQTKNANDILVSLELKAFSQISEGQKQEAIATLFSEEYEKQKRIYAEGMQNLLEKASISIKEQLNINQQSVIQFTLICGLIVLTSWITLLFILGNYKYKRRLAEKNMQVAAKRALDSEKMATMGELSASISHEVLNPVNVIFMHTQVLQQKMQNNPHIQDYCSVINREVRRITKILRSMLDISRIGNQNTIKGYLREDIEKVLILYNKDFKLRNINIVRNWCNDTVTIEYDPDRMRQVFLNLFNNAKHAMPDGGTITIACKPIWKSGLEFHQFSFSDTGVGIDEEELSKIFDPFFTTKPEGQGTGMGLSVVQGIIDEHGGEIYVESKKDKGTTFIIDLPLEEKN